MNRIESIKKAIEQGAYRINSRLLANRAAFKFSQELKQLEAIHEDNRTHAQNRRIGDLRKARLILLASRDK